MEAIKKQKINSIHVMRGLAIMMIVFTHCLGMFKNTNLISNSYLFSFLNLITFNFTTVFVLIGGFLFQHLTYKFNTKAYYISKLKTVICPYIVVSFFCIFIFHYEKLALLPWYSLHEPNIIMSVIHMTLTGTQLLPLWFIPMIAIIYLLSPVLYYWSNKNLIITSIICLFWVVIFPKPDYREPLLNLLHFGPVYLIGMMIRQNYDALMKAVKDSFLLVLFFFLLCFFIAFIHRYVENIGVSNVYLDTLQKIILFVVCLHLLEKLNHQVNNGYLYRFFSYMANLSFPLYFLHEIMIIATAFIMKHFNLGFILTTDNGSLASFGAVSILVSTLCMSLIMANLVMVLFKDKAKYLIGANR